MQPLIIWFLSIVLQAPQGVLPVPADAAPAECGADVHEPNDVRAKARPLPTGGAVASVCRGDEDWYVIHLDRGQRIELVARHAPGARLDLALFPPRARKPRGQRRRTPGQSALRYRARRAGNHRLRVRTRGAAKTAYGVELHLR